MTVRRARRAFTLLEVLAALAIASLLIAAIGPVVRGATGSIRAVDNAAARRLTAEGAAALVASLQRLGPGTIVRNGYRIVAEAAPFARAAALRRDGYVLLNVTVYPQNGDVPVYVGMRLAKP
jgi:prepilin-type N-terminal cleavage/methylation domain-containing protein